MDTRFHIHSNEDDTDTVATDRIIGAIKTEHPLGIVRGGLLQFPCSPIQRRLWLLHQLNPRDPSLNITARWRLEGAITIAELEKTFQVIMARHQILRTCFIGTGEELTQVVNPQISFHIPVIDLTKLPTAQARIEIERIAKQEAGTPFEVSVAPLIRVTHVRQSRDITVLLMTLHRLVCDVRSFDILARELSEAGSALHAGQQPVLPDLPISYGEYSARQVEQITMSARRIDAEYWRGALQQYKQFEIQTDRIRPAVLTANTDTLSLPLGRALSSELAQIGQRNIATPHHTVLAALLILLNRYTGETDIAIGTQFHGRDESNHQNLIGAFSSTLIVRNDLAGDPDFLMLLGRLCATLADVQQHRQVTPDELVEIVRPRPDLSRNPLYSVNFIFQGFFSKENPDNGLKVVESPLRSAEVTCDLTFSLVEGPNGWIFCCEYNLDLFESLTISRLLDHFLILLRAVAADPESKISNLAILEDNERHELVVENNRTSAIYPKHLTLPQLFEAQARRTPSAVAVVCGERSMSYHELDSASNRLAHELRRRGVGPGNRVGLFLSRSPDLMVALLAIHKSGSAYIPLDPAYPTERLQYIFGNSRPAAIITQASLCERLVHDAIPVIVVDSQSALIAKQGAEPLAPTASPNDLAYVIYTSGSTGRPKGVAIHHRALTNLVCAMRRLPGLTHEDTVVSVTTVSFDMSVPDLFLPLAVGAKLILAEEHEMADGAALYSLLQRHKATFMQATPVTWQLLLEAGWQGHPPLKMLCGGEAMSRKLADKLLDCGGELWNMYGPTETTVWSSALRIESGGGPVLIGPPIANTQFYILDSRQELVPHGVPGELFIGGDGVAHGYFDLADVTAEKFVTDKFSSHPGAVLYRTGDIVRLKQNGCMEFLGRADQQIKLRGYRIELGEIEAVLSSHSAIAESVVVLGQDPSGEAAIWAYVVTQRAQPESKGDLIEALRASLAQSLPGYMRPSSIVVLDALPRTPNGKIDRRSLPAPSHGQHESKETAQPFNEVERRLATIWCSILGLQGMEKTADFFELGGHSLLAARLLAQIDNEFGQRLSLLSLFQAPTIAAQAKLLMDSSQREYDFRQVVRLQPNGSKPPLIAIHNTGVYFYNLSRRLGPDQPLTALQLFDPSVSRPTLPQSLEEIAAEYVRLIRQYQNTGPYKLIGWCVGGVLAFEVARQLVDVGKEVSLLAMIDAWAPGHNDRLSRWRARLADYSYRLQLIGTDWRKVVEGEQTLTAFFGQRILVRKILHRFVNSPRVEPVQATAETSAMSAEEYDQWLLAYLEEKAQGYEPKLYQGKITLLCNTREPRGLFLDPQMGWGAFALGGVDVAVIDGDHFSMFKGRGLEQMATHISAVIDVYSNRGKRHAASA